MSQFAKEPYSSLILIAHKDGKSLRFQATKKIKKICILFEATAKSQSVVASGTSVVAPTAYVLHNNNDDTIVLSIW